MIAALIIAATLSCATPEIPLAAYPTWFRCYHAATVTPTPSHTATPTPRWWEVWK